MTRPSSVRRPALVLLMLVGAACGDAATQPGSPPARLVALSLETDSLGTSESTDPPLSVRVEDALGNPLEGTPVRFLVASGEGSVLPAVAVSDREGIAESEYRASGSPGEAVIRADMPSAPNVAAVEFRIFAEAADSVVLVLSEGDGQRAEIGSQLPIPFAVRAETPGATPAGGITIAFRIASAGRSAVLTADTVITGSDGVAQTLLTLGRDAGDYVVSAFATRGVHSDTAMFRAAATATFEGTVRLDSLETDSELVTGAEAVLHGYGFSPIAAENDVRIEGESATVTEATGTRLSILVPDFDGTCLPQRDVGVRVLVQGDASNGTMLAIQPAEPLVELDVGGTATIRGADALSCVQFGSDDDAEYVLALGSGDRRAGETTPVHLTTRVPTEPTAPGVATTLVPTLVDPNVEQEVTVRHRPDAELRRNVLADLVESRAAVALVSARPVVPTIPSPGDRLQFSFAARPDLTATCDGVGAPIEATVRAVGRHLALAEDAEAPGGGFGPEEWSHLLTRLDGIVAPTDTAYFGPHHDLDGNGRIVVLFTPRVNALSAPGNRHIGGFFLPLDLAATEVSGPGAGGGQACAASNQAEILYLAVADPEGVAGPALPIDRAIRDAPGLVAHELQHLINAQTRVLSGDRGFADAEEIWLDEALSSVAEEVVGLAVLEQPLRSRLTYDRLSVSRAEMGAFETFQLGNFFNLAFYLADPAALDLAAPDPAAELRARGFGWLLLRWMGDHSGGDERILFREIVRGGRRAARGIANIEEVFARPWTRLMEELSVAISAPDLDDPGEPRGVHTWDLQDLFAALNRAPGTSGLFPTPTPFRPHRLAPETTTLGFDVGAFTTRYFSLVTGPDAPTMSLALSTPGSPRLSETPEPQITIVRIR